MKFKKFLKILYIAVFFAATAVIGAAGFIKKDNNPSKEYKTEFNPSGYMDFAKQFDEYFSSGFGFRSNFIYLNNLIKYNLFNESGEDSVILGKDGWLFYESALHDYAGMDRLTAEQIGIIADSIRDMQDKAEENGTMFVFAAVPNKMEIYGKYMPYFLMEDCTPGNYELLMQALEERHVNYVDLKKVFKNSSTYMGYELYHRLDSHWNNLGASVAYMAIMDKTEFCYTDYSEMEFCPRQDFTGDLYEMLFPQGELKDWQYYYQKEASYEFTSRYMGEDDIYISTINESRDKKVLLFRDSFGNALFDFFAEDFKYAEISRELPYNITKIQDTDLIVVEIVERNIPNLLDYPPVTE